jgi:hypothetical protein
MRKVICVGVGTADLDSIAFAGELATLIATATTTRPP